MEPVTHDERKAQLLERLSVLPVANAQDAADKLLAYHALLKDWNTRMNLTGDASFEALLDRHVMDSLTPLSAGNLLPVHAAVIDVGSGAGFPGVPLAIVRPDLSFTLLDSLQKRVGFLQTVAAELGLGNLTAVHARAEDAAQSAAYRERFDVALARAVSSLPVLMELLLPFVKPAGSCLCFKGPSVDAERPAGAAAAGMLGGGKPSVIPVQVPGLPELRHCLVTVVKEKPTPAQYPRRAGVPAKSPLGM